jgi:hypothetical protein
MVNHQNATHPGIKSGWITSQVDYTSALAQAELKEEVYVEPPKYVAPGNGTDLVLHLSKSLYGLKQAPKHSLRN